MARRFLILGKYTQSGMAGALADGFESRREVMTDAITSMGGRLIDYSFCMGEYDFTVLAEYEDESKAWSAPNYCFRITFQTLFLTL